MIKEENNWDDLLRSRLEQFSTEPPPEVWERIQTGMARNNQKSGMLLFRRLTAAAVLLIAVVTGVLVITQQPQPVPSAASDHQDASVPGKAAIPTSSPATGFLAENTPAPGDKRIIGEAASLRYSPLPEKEAEERKECSSILDRVAGLIHIQNPLDLLDGYLPAHDLAPCSGKRGTPLPLSGSGNTPILAMESNKRVKTGRIPGEWEIGVRLSPAYSSYSSKYSNSYAQSMTPSENQSQTGVGGGVSVQYKTSGRWKLESGIYYSRSGDKSGNPIKLYAADAAYASVSDGVKRYVSNTVSLSDGQMKLNSTAGIICFKETPVDSRLIPAPESALGMSTTLLTSGEFAQVFDFMEIPLSVRYRLVDDKIGVELLSGISTNFVVGNQVFIGNGSSREYIGKTSNISRIGFSGLAGIGVIYPLGKNISLSVEPRASYWLSSLNTSDEVVFKPWKIGVFSGLTYSF